MVTTHLEPAQVEDIIASRCTEQTLVAADMPGHQISEGRNGEVAGDGVEVLSPLEALGVGNVPGIEGHLIPRAGVRPTHSSRSCVETVAAHVGAEGRRCVCECVCVCVYVCG